MSKNVVSTPETSRWPSTIFAAASTAARGCFASERRRARARCRRVSPTRRRSTKPRALVRIVAHKPRLARSHALRRQLPEPGRRTWRWRWDNEPPGSPSRRSRDKLLGAEKEARMKIRAGAFADGGRVPTSSPPTAPTCRPKPRERGAPGAKAFARIMDPDAGRHGNHWLLYDLPGDTCCRRGRERGWRRQGRCEAHGRAAGRREGREEFLGQVGLRRPRAAARQAPSLLLQAVRSLRAARPGGRRVQDRPRARDEGQNARRSAVDGDVRKVGCRFDYP